ncbi:hypothetical protein [Bartonella sp. OT172YNZD]|uniref:hypothetical protein n=1 Tax=Bartonella sp. OT172YNZD TaxID=3243572 RepID=UPI0035CFA486
MREVVGFETLCWFVDRVLLVLVMLAIVLITQWYYGCVSGGMMGEGWRGCTIICVGIGVGDCGCPGKWS